MSNKQLMILGIVAAGMALWAGLLSHKVNRPRAQTASAALLQGLLTGQIDSIVLGTGDKEVKLTRASKGFAVTNKDNYPAMTKNINDLITNCLDIQTTEMVTRNPANHAELGVTEDKARNVVKFLDNEGKVITGVVIGDKSSESGGDFVRLINKNEVYVSQNVPWLQMGPLDYVNKKLAEVNGKEIVKVLLRDDQDSYTLRNDPNEGVIPETVPAGSKPKKNECEQVFKALENLTFNDVQKESEATAALEFNSTYMCQMTDSTVYTLKVAQKDDKYYLKCWAEFTDKTPIVKEKEQESPEQLKEKEAKLLARDAAATFTQRHKGWVYELSKWDGDKLVKKITDLVEAMEK